MSDPGGSAGDPVFLDLDGTLVDTLPDIAASANHVRAELGLAPLAVERVRGMIGDGVATLLHRALADAGGASVAELLPVFLAHHVKQCRVLVRPFPGVCETLERWRSEGRPMAVVTNKVEAFARDILDHLELAELLPVVVGGDSIGSKKPSPEPLYEAARQLGVPRGRGLMAGDGLQDLRAGKAAGLRTAAALYGYRDPRELRREGADAYWVAFGVPEAVVERR